MASTTWEEIKRLAADFQRVQLVETSYKLSERNCIEIVSKLIEMGKLHVLHSIDGKEFITEKHLEKEIYDELYVHDGRINIVQLQTLLNVDISHIESKVSEIVKNDSNLHLVLGQIVSKDYMNKISEEINELLQEKGSVSISELTNSYELPSDFIQQIVRPRVGTLIKGNFDGKIIYTQNYVNSQKALLAGCLEASIKPVRFSQIIKDCNLEVGMVFEIFDDLLSSGQIKGTLYGGRQEMSAVFVPNIYTKAQEQYVIAFFKQNGYVDYGRLKKIGLSDPDNYVRALFDGQNVLFLSSSCFASYYIDSLEAEVEDSFVRTGFCDLSQILPSVLSQNDQNELTKLFESKLKANNDSLIMSNTYLLTKKFLKELSTKFQAKMEGKADEDLRKPNYVLAFRTEHAVIGNPEGKAIAATTTPSKGSGKAKGKKGKETVTADSNDDNMIEVLFVDKSQLIKELQEAITDMPDELIEPMLEYFLKPLNHQYFDLLKRKVESGQIGSSSASKDASGKSSEDQAETGIAGTAKSPKKLTIKDVQEKVKLFLVNARLFEKAAKLFTDAHLHDALSKHLTKTVFAEIVNEMLKFLAVEQMINVNTEETLNGESRTKLIQKLKEPNKQRFTELNQALTNKSSGELIEMVEKLTCDTLEMAASKKSDQKREKEVLLQIRESTKASLQEENDPATVLHLTSLLLFYASTGHMLNAPGKFVPHVLTFLRADLRDDTFQKLLSFQNRIIEQVSKGKNGENEGASISAEQVEEVKAIGMNYANQVKTAAKQEKQ